MKNLKRVMFITIILVLFAATTYGGPCAPYQCSDCATLPIFKQVCTNTAYVVIAGGITIPICVEYSNEFVGYYYFCTTMRYY